MTSRAAELKRRREALLAQVNIDRELLGAQHARIAAGLHRADGWLTVARRVTPVAAVAAAILGVVIGPGRVVRILKTAAVPALLLRQLFARSGDSGSLDLREVVLRMLGRRHRPD